MPPVNQKMLTGHAQCLVATYQLLANQEETLLTGHAHHLQATYRLSVSIVSNFTLFKCLCLRVVDMYLIVLLMLLFLFPSITLSTFCHSCSNCSSSAATQVQHLDSHCQRLTVRGPLSASCRSTFSVSSFWSVFVWSRWKCSGPGSVTALIYSGQNRNEPDTGYLHSLDCSSVTYRNWNTAHVHLPLRITCPPDIRTNRDVNQLFVVLSFCLLYTQYGLHGPTPEQKLFRGQTEAMLRPGTVPVPVLVLSLILIHQYLQVI